MSSKNTLSLAQAGMALLTALVSSPIANAGEREDLRDLNAYLQRHLSISITAQLEQCRRLVEDGADEAVLAGCFRYATLVLNEGLRRRSAAPGRNEAFEARLAAVVGEVSERIDGLPIHDREKLEQQLRELDRVIRALRLELSRVAAVERMRLSLISRGGVSLGNWQAGFLYLLTEWAKGRPGQRAATGITPPAFSTVTGASAGAVNGFAAAIEGCKRPNPSAQDSLFYRAWIGLGLFGRHGKPGLFPRDRDASGPLSLFTAEALEETLGLAKHTMLGGGLLPHCIVDLGFVATHLAPTESPVHVRESGDPILSTQKLKEKFTVRLDSSGAGGGLGITNIGPPEAAKDDRLYYVGLGHEEEVAPDALLAGVRASAAFPGAFPPVRLAYTKYVPGPDGQVLPKEREETFIDGGVLDNTPVGLAVVLDEWRDEGPAVGVHLQGLVPPDPRTYVFIEPAVTSWTLGGPEAPEGREEPEADTKTTSMLGTYVGFAFDLLDTSTDAQLTNTAEQFSFVRHERPGWNEPRLSVPERNMPITGEQFSHFMAFMEQDFRIFDFYVGMADAYEYIRQEACFFSVEGEHCEPDGPLRRLDGALRQANPNYRCMRDYYDSDEARSLEKISTDQLPQACRELQEVVCEGSGPPDTEQAVNDFLKSGAVLSESRPDRCIEPAIANHNFQALLAGMHDYKVWMQSPDYSEEGELDHFFEALGGEPTERFIYVDLPTHLGRNKGYLDATEVRRGFRSLLQEGIDYVAAEQPPVSDLGLTVVGRTVADAYFGRDYPKHIIGLGIAQRGLEVGFGRRLGERPFRWDSTFRFFNLQNQSFGSGLNPFTGEFYLATQATGILPIASVADVELGAGWAISETVAFNSGSPGHVAFRTGPRASLALVLLQRLYVALNADYYPVNRKANAYRELDARVTNSWEWNLTAGFRFFP
jgi:predicted acylesterase/phospholipase RssA